MPRISDEREDAMLDSVAWMRVYLVGVGNGGNDPKWLEIRAERDADHVRWLLADCPGFKGVKVAWPRNWAVFGTVAGALEGKKALEDAGIPTGDIMTGRALPGLKEIRIKVPRPTRRTKK